MIQAGPGKDINTYICQLNKLRLAIDYFEVNKNQSQKKQNEDLWVQGKLNVDREFDQLLSKCSDTARAIIEHTDIESNDQHIGAKSLNLKEADLNQMNCIIEWFKQVEPKYLDQLYMKLIEARNKLILDKLKRISEKKSGGSGNQKTGGNLMAMSPGQSGSINRNSSSSVGLSEKGDKSSIRNRLTENLLNSSGSVLPFFICLFLLCKKYSGCLQNVIQSQV